jgi:hypothetical protein
MLLHPDVLIRASACGPLAEVAELARDPATTRFDRRDRERHGQLKAQHRLELLSLRRAALADERRTESSGGQEATDGDDRVAQGDQAEVAGLQEVREDDRAQQSESADK